MNCAAPFIHFFLHCLSTPRRNSLKHHCALFLAALFVANSTTTLKCAACAVFSINPEKKQLYLYHQCLSITVSFNYYCSTSRRNSTTTPEEETVCTTVVYRALFLALSVNPYPQTNLRSPPFGKPTHGIVLSSSFQGKGLDVANIQI